MNALSLIADVDKLEAPRVTTSPEELRLWVHFDHIGFHGKDPAKFRRFAQALNECADQLDTHAASRGTSEVHK